MTHTAIRDLVCILCCSLVIQIHAEAVFTRGVDLYYGLYNGTETPNKYYNHQLWLTTDGLTYDGQNIIGTDGCVMRLDLFCNSATDLSGTYEIVGPKYSDAAGCMNKKFTYYTYFEAGGFYERKLTIGTCTIVCTSATTYDITYHVQEIDGGTIHQGSLHDIPISAITYQDKPYQLVPQCTNYVAIDETMTEQHNGKRILRGQLVIDYQQQTYDIMGRKVNP